MLKVILVLDAFTLQQAPCSVDLFWKAVEPVLEVPGKLSGPYFLPPFYQGCLPKRLADFLVCSVEHWLSCNGIQITKEKEAADVF